MPDLITCCLSFGPIRNTSIPTGETTMKHSGTRQLQQAKWSVMDSHLYNQIFTGRARKLPVRTHCGVSTHCAEGCPSTGGPAWKRFARDAVSTSLLQILFPMGTRGLDEAAKEDVCWAFKAGHCKYVSTCRFWHMCSLCSGRHPEASCPRKGAETSKMLVQQQPYAATVLVMWH